MGTGKLWSLVCIVFVLFTFLFGRQAITCGCEGSSHTSRAGLCGRARLPFAVSVAYIASSKQGAVDASAAPTFSGNYRWSGLQPVEPQSHAGI